MGTLNLAEFNSHLDQFITLNNGSSREKWTLHKVISISLVNECDRYSCLQISSIALFFQSDAGLYAKQSVMVKWKEESINRQVDLWSFNRHLKSSGSYHLQLDLSSSRAMVQFLSTRYCSAGYGSRYVKLYCITVGYDNHRMLPSHDGYVWG